MNDRAMPANEVQQQAGRCALVDRSVVWCRDLLLRAPLLCSLLIALVLLTTSVAMFRISYETNDDVFMTMIASGTGFCSAPDEHLVFSNALLGGVLKQLYTELPGVPWYGGYLLLAHYAAQVALLYCALTMPPLGSSASAPDRDASRSFGWRITAYLVYFAVVELVLLNQLQFTSTAFVVAQAGCFLLARAAARFRAESQVTSGILLIAAAGLIVLAGMIRPDSLYLALIVLSPLALLVAMSCPRAAIVPVAVTAGLAAVLVVAANDYNRAAYENDDRWHGFYAFNALRCKFNDYGWTDYTPETASVFAAVGWNGLDHEMIAHWFFDDPVKYSEAKLRTIVESYPWKTARWTPGYPLAVLRRPLQDRAVWAMWLVLPLLLSLTAGSRQSRRAVGIASALAVVLLVGIGLNNKVPPLRIYFPLLAIPLSSVLLLAGSFDRCAALGGFPLRRAAWRSFRPWSRAVVVMLVVGVAMGVYRQARRTVRVERDRQELAAFLASAQADSGKLYVAWEAALPYELLSPLDSLAGWRKLEILNLTWTQRTPWQDAVKRRRAIGYLEAAICQRDDIVLVATPVHRELFEVYARQRCEQPVEFAESHKFGDRSSAGRFVVPGSARAVREKSPLDQH